MLPRGDMKVKRIVSGIMLILLVASMLTLTFSIHPAKAEYLFFDNFDTGLVQWNNFGYPTPSTFQDPSFEDGWGYSTEGDSWHLSGSWSKQLIDISQGIIVEFRVKQDAGNVWDYLAIGIGALQSGYSEEYGVLYFGIEIEGHNPNDNLELSDDILYEASPSMYIEDAANDHQFHIFKLVYDGLTNDVEFYKDGNFIVKLNAGPRPYDELPLYIIGRDYHDTNYLDWIRVSPFQKPEHDLAVSLKAPSFLKLGDTALFNVTVANFGLNNETNVALQLLINNTIVDSITIPELLAGLSYTLSYAWTPTVGATYNVTAYAPPLSGENVTANNVATKLVQVITSLPIVWEAVYDEGRPEYFVNVAVDSKGNLIAVGAVLINAATREQAMLIAKYNQNGELLWSKKINPYLLTMPGTVAVDSGDNIIIFTITSTNKDAQDYGGSQIAEWMIMKLSPDGNLIWDTRYRKEGMGYHREGVSGLIVYNDEIICTGVAGYQFRVIKLDSNGNLLWETRPSIGAQGQGITIDKNGDIIVSGQTSLYPPSDVCLIKLSQSGGELWSKRFDWGGNEMGREVAVDADNNIVVVGEGAPPFIAKFNPNGEQIWKRDYIRPNIDRAWHLEVWPNRYAISVFSDAGKSPPYYVEYDYNGNLVFEAVFAPRSGCSESGGSISKDKYGRLIGAWYTGTWPEVNATLTVYGYPPLQLTIKSTPGGATDPYPATYHYHAGDTVNVTAIPNTGYSFNYWLLDGDVRTENPINIIMDANHTLEAYFIDNIKPEIGEPTQDPPPENVQPNQDVTVTVTIVDYGSGVKNVTLWYSLNNGTTWTILNMTELAANTYQATLPGYGNCTWITYKIIAYDNTENMAVKDNNGYNYQYHVIPEIPLTTMFIASLILTTLITIITPKTKRKHQSTNFSL
ncbi:MAG: CARDB domain-containing protein [Candidatus Bathyarchaeia archaeon]